MRAAVVGRGLLVLIRLWRSLLYTFFVLAALGPHCLDQLRHGRFRVFYAVANVAVA